MELIDLAVERTTAATDLLLSVVAFAATVWLARRPGDAFRRGLWCAIFGLLALAAGLGAVAHGLQMPETTRWMLWQPLFLSLGWSVGLFVVAVVLDVKGRAAALRALPIILFLGLAFYGMTVWLGGHFGIFLVYQGVALLTALVAYSVLLLRRRLAGSRWLVAGITLILIASTVQATEALRFTFVWPFDHNGIFHLLLLPAVVFLVLGVEAALRAEAAGEPAEVAS